MVDQKYQKYSDVILEHIVSQNKAVLELVGSMKDDVQHMPQIREDISELKTDVKTIKTAGTDTNKDLTRLEKRVTKLETTHV